MAKRRRRSISLPPELDKEIEAAAAESGTTVSAWFSAIAAHRLRMDAARHAIADATVE